MKTLNLKIAKGMSVNDINNISAQSVAGFPRPISIGRSSENSISENSLHNMQSPPLSKIDVVPPKEQQAPNPVNPVSLPEHFINFVTSCNSGNMQSNQPPTLPPNYNIYMNITLYVNNTPPTVTTTPEKMATVPTIQPTSGASPNKDQRAPSTNNIQLKIEPETLNMDEINADKILFKREFDEKNMFNTTPYNVQCLKKRSEPKKKCKCMKKRSFEELQKYYRLLAKRIQKTKKFWNGVTNSYPFCFKKRVMNYYVDTDETSVNEIMDFSQKALNAEDSESDNEILIE